MGFAQDLSTPEKPMANDLPVVKIYRNPWPSVVPDGALLHILLRIARQIDEDLHELVASGHIESDYAFGVVILDPTRPRSATSISDRVLAAIPFGPNGWEYLPSAAATADAHDRHRVHNAQLVDRYPHLLGNNDFACGDSAEYELAIGGGSGLPSELCRPLVHALLVHFIDSVKERLMYWRATQRRGNISWCNRENKPGAEHTAILDLVPIVGTYLDAPFGHVSGASLTAGSNAFDLVNQPPPN